MSGDMWPEVRPARQVKFRGLTFGIWGDDQYMGWNVSVDNVDVIGNIHQNAGMLK